MRPSATMNPIPTSVPREPPAPSPDTIMDRNSALNVIARRIKSMRNKHDYQRRKVLRVEERAQEQLETQKMEMGRMQDKLNDAHDQIADLEHTNQQSLRLAQKHKEDANKSSELLAKRTQRFLVFRARQEDDLKRVRAAAARRIDCLRRQHQLELNREEACRYRMERAHVKEIVVLESKLASVQKSAE